MSRLGGRWQRFPVGHGREVRLFAALRTYLLKNAAVWTGGRTGFQCCHGLLLKNWHEDPVIENPERWRKGTHIDFPSPTPRGEGGVTGYRLPTKGCIGLVPPLQPFSFGAPALGASVNTISGVLCGLKTIHVVYRALEDIS